MERIQLLILVRIVKLYLKIENIFLKESFLKAVIISLFIPKYFSRIKNDPFINIIKNVKLVFMRFEIFE